MLWHHFWGGLHYALPFLLILTCHEFGHYLTARYYRAKVTLPYYIPFWVGGIVPHIGTLGALIQIKSTLKSTKEYFDVAIAGPLAGFIVAIGFIIYGFTHLPGPEYLFTANPDYMKYGLDFMNYAYNQDRAYLVIGDNLLFWICEQTLTNPSDFVPNQYELIHYPFLFAGYLACFFTALNLFPIGQLDGGHILYGLFGIKWHGILSRIVFIGFVTYAGIGVVQPLQLNSNPIDWQPFAYHLLYILFLRWILGKAFRQGRNAWMWVILVYATQYFIQFLFPGVQGYHGWLFFALILSRVLGLYHPPAQMEQSLSPTRKVMGYISLLVFILCFSPQPFQIIQ